MPLADLVVDQLSDPFRIGLIVALVWTTRRTAQQTGLWLPLLAGLLFVAVIIPSTMPQNPTEPLWRLIATGFVANIVILTGVLAIAKIVLRLRT